MSELRAELGRIQDDFESGILRAGMDCRSSDYDCRVEAANRLRIQQSDAITKLAVRFNHSIVRALDPDVARLSVWEFGAFMYAFGLTDGVGLANTFEFAQYLIDRELKEVAPDKARTGDVIIYSNRRRITHGGRMDGGRVVSKWGPGNLWNHRVFEVPGQYGSDVRFFQPLPREEVERVIGEYVSLCFDKPLVMRGCEISL